MDKVTIGKVIKDRRDLLEVNQQTVADLSEVGLNTLLAIERGYGNPRIDTLLKILNTLGLEMTISPKK